MTPSIARLAMHGISYLACVPQRTTHAAGGGRLARSPPAPLPPSLALLPPSSISLAHAYGHTHTKQQRTSFPLWLSIQAKDDKGGKKDDGKKDDAKKDDAKKDDKGAPAAPTASGKPDASAPASAPKDTAPAANSSAAAPKVAAASPMPKCVWGAR